MMYRANKGYVLVLCPESLILLLCSGVVVMLHVVILRKRIVSVCKDISMLKLKPFCID